jgi:hypothetical protein
MDQVRKRLDALRTLGPDASEWVPFMRDVMRMPMWLLPAVQAAIQQGGWTGATDPLIAIRGAVRRLAIEMKLSNSEKPDMAELLKAAEEED